MVKFYIVDIVEWIELFLDLVEWLVEERSVFWNWLGFYLVLKDVLFDFWGNEIWLEICDVKLICIYWMSLVGFDGEFDIVDDICFFLFI